MIETERLVLRPPSPVEREALHALWTDPANSRVDGDAAPEQVRAWIDGVPSAVFERATGELVGDCGLHFDAGFGEWELAYGLRRDRWGRGYATEAAAASVRHGFEELGVERIVADVDPANVASIRVLEKCGFEHVDTLDDGRLFYAVKRSSARGRAVRAGA